MRVEERVAQLGKPPGQHPIFRLIRPAYVVACIYLLFIGLDSLLHGHNALYYVHIGSRYALHELHGTGGYDGQFFYYIARDPLHAAPFLSHPAYRYQRIVYPLLVAVLSLGQENLIPYMLLLVNFVAIACLPGSVSPLVSTLDRRLPLFSIQPNRWRISSSVWDSFC